MSLAKKDMCKFLLPCINIITVYKYFENIFGIQRDWVQDYPHQSNGLCLVSQLPFPSHLLHR